MLKIMDSDVPHTRMVDRQLILRFFAMWRNTHLKYKGPMKRFLNSEMEKHRHLSQKELVEMQSIFEKSIEMAYTAFGGNAFHRFNPGKQNNPNGAWENKKLNVALWDTLLYTFSFYEKDQILPIADRVREEFLDLMTNDSKFTTYITSTTDKPERIQYRADVWRHRLQTLVGLNNNRANGFSLQFKQELFNRNCTCHICWQPIQHVDDAAIAHIQDYWKAPKKIQENARLDHRYCHKSRYNN